MSDRNPCPFCGDESEYWRFLDLCAERASEIWRENEVEIFTTLYESMDFVQVVRCRDCKYYVEEWNRKLRRSTIYCDWLDGAHVEPDGFCKWGERRELGEDNDNEIY